MDNNNKAYDLLNKFTIDWLENHWTSDLEHRLPLVLKLEKSKDMESILGKMKNQVDFQFLGWLVTEILLEDFIKDGINVEEVYDDQDDKYVYWIFKIDDKFVKLHYDKRFYVYIFSFVKKVTKTIEIEIYEDDNN